MKLRQHKSLNHHSHFGNQALKRNINQAAGKERIGVQFLNVTQTNIFAYEIFSESTTF
jgi:hypothetical protein